MHETDEEMRALQELLDRSATASGGHLRSIMTPEKRLSARQVAAHLQGVRQVAFASSTSNGEPMVSPVDAVFYHGRFYASTDPCSVRARHVRSRPGVSVAYFVESEVSVVVHGTGAFVDRATRASRFAELDAEWVRRYGSSILWIAPEGVFIEVEPRRMFAYAPDPSRFPDK